jgi:N-acylneuraminate cytidylyltransferase
MSESAYKTLEMSPEGWLAPLGMVERALDTANLARQGFPTTYVANGYVDVLSVRFIRSTGLMHGDRVMAFLTPPAVEVDTEMDFQLLEYCVANDPSLVSPVKE